MISVIGMGFVGLTLAAFVASKKVKTIGIDSNNELITQLQKGTPHFYEPGLKQMLARALRNKAISFSSKIDAIKESDIVFVCVGTPSSSTGEIDLSAISEVSKSIGHVISNDDKYRLVVVKSTVVPGTTANVVLPAIEKASSKAHGSGFGLIVNPEFLREGSAMNDTIKPHLIVIGRTNEKDSKIMKSFYSKLYRKSLPEVIVTTPSTAEMIKYANNAFLATKISFINSIANICQRIPQVDVEDVAKAIGHDPRIGRLFLKAGPGYGGSCLPKDVSALISFCEKDLKLSPVLIKATSEVNDDQPYEATRLAESQLGNLAGKKISVLGLAFKKNTDDIREAVSLKVISLLLKQAAIVSVHDPMAMNRVRDIFGNSVNYCNTIDDCIRESECCIILTEWDAYSHLKPSFFVEKMKNPLVIDARRVLDPSKFEGKLAYFAIGRSKVPKTL